jgi:prevent-host-death family protein
MIKVSKGLLKAKMLEYFRRVEQTGEELIVTNNNIPTLKVIPIKEKHSVEEVFGDLIGKVKIDDSIMKPELEEWGDNI